MNIKFIDRRTGKLTVETPPAEGLLKLLYDNPFGAKTLLPIVKRKFVSDWYGRRMNRSNSVKKIKEFVTQLNIDMTESQKSIEEFTSFNDFFYRKLKPSARPIEEGFVSPGDGKLLAFERVEDVGEFFIKSRKFSLTAFLKSKDLAQKYKDASMLILRLAPNDYHRYHFPWNGTPSSMNKIDGAYYSVSPYALAKHFTTVFCENKREYCILNTQDKGDVLLAPVGATMVGGIVETFATNQPIEKGDEMGYFTFGGSTIVVLVDQKHLTIDKDILENTKNKIETFVRMGEKIGV